MSWQFLTGDTHPAVNITDITRLHVCYTYSVKELQSSSVLIVLVTNTMLCVS